MPSLKFKPLSEQPIRCRILDARGEVLEDRVLQQGEYLDLTLPEGGRIILTEPEAKQ